uniref:Reprolysin n=1 Tax=Rhipicephalus zambeziensis TaxID=60191 RepID=A0A224YP54_9ACAR
MNRATFSHFQVVFLALICASYIGSTLCKHVEWHIEIGLLLDAHYHPHPPSALRSLQEYYEEMFNSLSRRLSLIGMGRFVFIWTGLYKLTTAESQILFWTPGRKPTTIEVHRNWISPAAVPIRARVRRKDAVILLTKRTLTLPNGADTTGFAVKSGMCTKDDLIVVHDDGMFSGENNLLRYLLHSAGVDYDGSGTASRCSAFGGYLMGSGLLRLPLEFSHCTMALAFRAFSRLTCITSKIGRKAGHLIPKPPKVSREEFCAIFGADPCDDKGTGKYEHKRPEKYECYAFCCKGISKIIQMAGPDGLKCDEDVLYSKRKRCLLGRCKTAA